MNNPTWAELFDNYCANERIHTSLGSRLNPFYEQFANRRYNPSPIIDKDRCRLVFLKDVMENKTNKTLRRSGRFIWCKELSYEGKDNKGFRQVSFSIHGGTKRFTVSENNVLCVPSKVYVHNNRYFKTKLSTFKPFSSVFGYERTLAMMSKNGKYNKDEFLEILERDNPYKPGALVIPRLGYFHPEVDEGAVIHSKEMEHPCGIILGQSFMDDYYGREFYRVRFGSTTYEKVHPVQMEIINEI
jgi:hypothetical protein